MTIPILMITCGRLQYTKQALESLFNCRKAEIFIIDNGSQDGTKEWLESQPWKVAWKIKYNAINIGIAGAMNQFLEMTKNNVIVGKVDNDTIVPPDFIVKMLPHLEHVDIVQAKHKLIPASGVGTFDEWVEFMPKDGAIRRNHFVGGSGILFKRQLVNKIPETQWKLGGWREWQRQHGLVRKGFATDVEIQLLDEHGYSDYPEYYKETKRL